ncbi:hypothetical protein [cf. Phormidesmis sp. LEGE 11477]|uniref:hypothetical protein n=1 Tax=cf. Phormidesmis sp. LEGE 11477 TaxID=1828680 RepID=UPI001880845D|nr:hypothetical protein [cf. Phormidesmis sp. LEGE 11477]MBE9060717.1 hypothetical protein [cf. Phormidesmis sp. LEGE 11477]
MNEATNQVDQTQDLKNCLTSEPLGHLAAYQSCDLETYIDAEAIHVGTQGKSRASRQAQAIRNWQQRRRRFETFSPR